MLLDPLDNRLLQGLAGLASGRKGEKRESQGPVTWDPASQSRSSK